MLRCPEDSVPSLNVFVWNCHGNYQRCQTIMSTIFRNYRQLLDTSKEPTDVHIDHVMPTVKSRHLMLHCPVDFLTFSECFWEEKVTLDLHNISCAKIKDSWKEYGLWPISKWSWSENAISNVWFEKFFEAKGARVARRNFAVKQGARLRHPITYSWRLPSLLIGS